MYKLYFFLFSGTSVKKPLNSAQKFMLAVRVGLLHLQSTQETRRIFIYAQRVVNTPAPGVLTKLRTGIIQG